MTAPVRVVHLVSTLGIGGQEMVILQLVQHLDRSKFTPMVVALRGGGPLRARIEAMGVSVMVLGDDSTGHLTMIMRIMRALREHRADILHTHNPAPHQLGAIAARLARTPVVIHTKHGRNNISRLRRRLAQRLAGRLTDLVVPVSDDSAQVAKIDDGVPERKLWVIRNGVKLSSHRDTGPRPTGAPTRAVHVARLHAIKDQSTLLRAVRSVLDVRPDFTLDIVGEGPAGAEIRQLSQHLGLAQAVTFHGMQDDVARFLDQADLFLLSSLSEGISLTLLEAMAFALPVIATDVGGNREVVIEGVTGLLVPPADPEAMARAILTLVDDPKLRHRLGEAGRRRAESSFSLDHTVSAYQDAYLRLLRSRLGPVSLIGESE